MTSPLDNINTLLPGDNKILTGLEMPHKCQEFYYEEAPVGYFLESPFSDSFIRFNESGIRRVLKSKGMRPNIAKNEKGDPAEPLSQVDQLILHVQQTRCVKYTGGLAGYPKGYKKIHGTPVLITEEADLLIPRQGEFQILQQLLNNMFSPDEDGGTQLSYFLGWLKGVLSGIYGNSRKFRQVCALTGDPESGKSLLQRLLTEMTGRRVAKPFQFMTGQTSFNAELFAAEHLMIEDEFVGADQNTRKHLAANIKQIAANEDQYCHKKNRTAWTLRPYWYCTITLNTDPDALRVLPDLDGSIDDKLMIFHVRKKPMPMPTETAEEKDAFWNRLMQELPCFVHHLLNHHMIDQALISARYTVKHYHYAEIVEQLTPILREERLNELLELTVFKNSPESWIGSTTELFEALVTSAHQRVFETISRSPSTLGRLLEKLNSKYPNRVSVVRPSGRTLWTIRAPTL